jgi:hypothetical protein
LRLRGEDVPQRLRLGRAGGSGTRRLLVRGGHCAGDVTLAEQLPRARIEDEKAHHRVDDPVVCRQLVGAVHDHAEHVLSLFCLLELLAPLGAAREETTSVRVRVRVRVSAAIIIHYCSLPSEPRAKRPRLLVLLLVIIL